MSNLTDFFAQDPMIIDYAVLLFGFSILQLGYAIYRTVMQFVLMSKIKNGNDSISTPPGQVSLPETSV